RRQLADAANRVLIFADFLDQRDHAFGSSGIGTAHLVGFHLVEGYLRLIGNGSAHVPNLSDIADNPNAMLTKQLFGDSSRRDPAQGLAGAGSAAAAIVAEAIFGVECEVGMPWPVLVLDLAVIRTALIGVAEEDADGRTVGLALEDAGPDFGNVLF